MNNMGLLQEWRDFAYAKDMNDRSGQLFWANYFNMEKEVYQKLLVNPDKVWEGSVASLAQEFDMELTYFVGFLDGINDSLVTPNPIEEMDQDTRLIWPLIKKSYILIWLKQKPTGSMRWKNGMHF